MRLRRRLPLLVLLTIAAVACLGPAATAGAAVKPQKLFALDADRGTLTPVAGRPGVQSLVLEPVRARALYFTDRPVREAGTVAVRPMLRALFGGDSPPPNAAVNATAADRGQLLMGVELRAWSYDARAQRLTLRVRHLRRGARRTTFRRVRGDAVLPRSFHDVSLFIDDCCGTAAPVTIFNPGPLSLAVMVNNGSQLFVPPADPPQWLPGSPTTGVSFSSSGPQPGMLGPGTNFVSVTPTGAVTPIEIPITLPASIRYDAVQLYIFVGNSGSLVWTVLNDGQLVASGTAGQP